MARATEYILGYRAAIHSSLWTRILSAGVPRMWFILEVLGGIFFTFALFIIHRSVFVACLPIALAILVHVGMVVLMRWDPEWDSVLLYSFRYRSFYDAG